MKPLALLFLLVFSSSFAFADEPADEPRSQYIRPCSFWSYQPEARGYVCNNPGFNIQIMEAYEVERYINDLQRQLDDLERRVRVLESGKK